VLTLSGDKPPDAGPGCSGLVVTPGQTTVTVSPGPTVYVAGGLLGQYFNNFDTTQLNPAWVPVGSRVDSSINFDWSAAGPGVNGIGQSNYSVRWTGKVLAATTGLYTFETTTDDAVRLWVNGQLLVDKWIQQGATAYQGSISLIGGQQYDIRMEYNQGGGGASALLRWAVVAVPPKTGNFQPGGLLGEYFAKYSGVNIDPGWAVTWGRVDPTVNFDWSAAAPGVPGVAQTNFSVRWTGKVKIPTAGNYVFSTRTDDGARLWINGALVVDKWIPQGATTYNSPSLALGAGQMVDVKMEYNQGGGGAVAQLSWQGPGIATQIIPASALYYDGGTYTQTQPMQVIPPSALFAPSQQGSYVFSPSTVQMQAQLQPVGCYPGPFTPAWTIDRPDLATIDGTGLVSLVTPVAGVIKAKAYGGSFVGQGNLNVVVSFTDTVNAPPGVTDAQFAGNNLPPDPMTVVYPYVDTVFPLAIKAPVVQWNTNGVAATATKVTLRYPSTGTPLFNIGVLSGESSPPRVSIPQPYWQALEQTAKGNEAAIVVQRLVNGSPMQEVVRKFRFAAAELRGRIYYTEYNSASFKASELAIDPSSTSGPVNIFPTNPGGCPVCHSVSSSGNRFATSNWGSQGGNGVGNGISRINADNTVTNLVDMPATAPYNSGSSDWRSFAWAPLTPDGSYALSASNIWGNTGGGSVSNSSNGNNGNNTSYFIWRLPNAPGGALVDATAESPNRWGLSSSVMMVPSFSPDGKKIRLSQRG
jgi:hypothetical protein